jgi:hypothetical protein
MPTGTSYFNISKPKYDIDVTKATNYFMTACEGDIWANGMSMTLFYNIGNVARQTTAEMLAYNIENLISWPGGIVVTIDTVGVPWSVYLPGMKNQQYPTFIVGWLADYPDPHNWLFPFMHTAGTYAGRQVISYGLETPSLIANWYAGATIGPPPYTNWFGEHVNAINNTYVDSLIDRGIGLPGPGRQAVYEELHDIYYADATQLPMCYPMVRHYERTWINGWENSYNENDICPGDYYYTIWKAEAGTVRPVDISAQDTITNTTVIFDTILLYHGDMLVGGGSDAETDFNYTLHIARLDTNVPATVYVYVALYRTSTGGYYFPLDFYIPLAQAGQAGDTYTTEVEWWEGGTMEEGVWTIQLYTSPSYVDGVDECYDSNLANNIAAHPQTVNATELFGDIRADGDINILDALRLSASFGLIDTHPDYNPEANLKPDVPPDPAPEEINILDAIVLAGIFGNHVP